RVRLENALVIVDNQHVSSERIHTARGAEALAAVGIPDFAVIGNWNQGYECGPGAMDGLDDQISADVSQDRTRDAQTEPGPHTDAFGGEERIENVLDGVRRDAWPGVGHRDRDELLVGTRRDTNLVNRPLHLADRVGGVDEDVDKNLGKSAVGRDHAGKLGREVALDVTGYLDFAPHQAQGTIDDLVHVDDLGL